MSDRYADPDQEIAALRAERDQLAAELEHARHFRKAVEEAPIGIGCIAAGKGRYAFANRAFADLMGQSHESILQRDPYQVWVGAVHPDDFPAEQAGVGKMATGEIRRHRSQSRLVPGGREARWVRADLVGSSYVDGRLEHVTAYLTDIHEEQLAKQARAELEAQVQRTQKMEAMGRLVGGIAHDFNNRLVIIMGYCELLKAGLGAQHPLAGHIDTVLASSEGAAGLTRQLLAYSRRQVLNPEAFDLNEMVERMRGLLKSVAGDRIELRIALAAQSKVLADSGQVEQVIMNLALNARDAMGATGGGILGFETGDVVVAAGEERGVIPGDYVSLAVSDTGTGIPDDVLPRIFEPFFTTKDAGRGTGLGLAMVEGIVRQSGGRTSVESRVGVGTRFRVLLPRAPDTAAPAHHVVEKPLPARNGFETVLVCDDDDTVRELLTGILTLRGYSILKATNGRQALEVAREYGGNIDLLLTDLAMPGVGGIELAAELRRRDPELKVLYISGYSEDADLVSMSLGPRTYFVAKPFLPGDLTRAVSAILEGRPSAEARRPSS
jgi:PAS domain S-box-containing protein